MDSACGRPLVATVVMGLGAWYLATASGACVTNESVEDEQQPALSSSTSGGGSYSMGRWDGGLRDRDGGVVPSSSGGSWPEIPDGGSSNSSSGAVSITDGGAPKDGSTPTPHPDANGWTPGSNPSCTIWQDCPPHFSDLNSGFDCVGGQCLCDSTGQWSTKCTQAGAFWVAAECFCVFQSSSGPPGENPDPNPDDDVYCWWSWHSDGCEPDRWVDTSHYERRCETVSGETVCRNVWVNSGYWEDGDCSGGRWIKRCSDGTVIWY